MNSPRSRLSGAAYTERAVEMVARLRDPCRTKLPVAQRGASGSQGRLWPERDLQPLGAGPPGRGLCQEQAFAPLHVWARGPYTRPLSPPRRPTRRVSNFTPPRAAPSALPLRTLQGWTLPSSG